ncbi:DUF2238 domain-containing protein [Lentzea albida]|uniref:Putative membrane protein n=1 Tax=Lentzea albida TaxID=65499 RepID=A0A1H9UEP4_9PSEU|nr:DUF2238 domain-containing protein [Lentzea albida]SES08040.1 putative membrane protein [Lentzea albida]
MVTAQEALDTAEQALPFLALHTVAARWIYLFVSYDDWADALLGVRLPEAFSRERNHFDRLVHFNCGVCLMAVLRRKWLRSLEVVLAMTLAPEVAEAYNGQQGDMWDAHADMALAALGALVTSLVSSAPRRSRAEATRSPAPGAARPARQDPGRAR